MSVIEAVFRKSGPERFISHLDFVRLIYRALRRADIPFQVTEGFSPRPRVKFGQALKVGVPGEIAVQFLLKTEVSPEEFYRFMHPQLTKGVSIVSVNYGK